MNLLLHPAFDEPDLRISEVFGPTLQGEGPSCGQRALFIRLADCNLACDWCDTPYSWRWSDHDRAEEPHLSGVNPLLARIRAEQPALVVITGGEPLLQQFAVEPLVGTLTEEQIPVEIETNGTQIPGPLLGDARFNVSPKLANSGMKRERRIVPKALRALNRTGRAVFKFVVEAPEELDEVEALTDEFDLHPVWIMPQAANREELLTRQAEIADEVIARGWNLSTRMQTLLWGGERGR